MDCANVRDDMLDVLYEEATPQARQHFEEHAATCVVCREELAALRALRVQLAGWKLPAAGVGVAGSRSALRPRAPRVLHGLAWAAGLLLALGAAIRLSGVSVEFQRGPIALQLGGPHAAALQAAFEARLAEQEARHRREIEALRASLVAQGGPVAPRPAPLAVRELIRESEARQAEALEARLAGFEERADARRRYDMARISAGLSYLDGKAGQQAARTTELVSYVLQASQPR